MRSMAWYTLLMVLLTVVSHFVVGSSFDTRAFPK